MLARYIHYFSPQPKPADIPEILADPLDYQHHPLAIRAGNILQSMLEWGNNDAGIMYGVLVVKDKNARIGFLSAYSGRQAYQAIFGSNSNAGFCKFVPPVLNYNPDGRKTFLFNSLGEKKAISEIWSKPYIDALVGSCAAIKLFQYANLHRLQPLAFAEFWWGLPPEKSVRHHGQYYPACSGRCAPLLGFMLQGIKVESKQLLGVFDADDQAPDVVYEDEDVVVVNKPAGLLSVPGRNISDSVLTRMQARYPDASGPLLLHRLDMATSGLLLVAKNKNTHKALQKQFLQHTIEKRYIAILSKPLDQKTGRILLPLCMDYADRPRQQVCYDRGKQSQTNWELIHNDDETARVYLYPLTGRTHQLRVHAAHKDGLNAPIMGDCLYGTPASRLLLHAQKLVFTHPANGKRTVCESDAPF